MARAPRSPAKIEPGLAEWASEGGAADVADVIIEAAVPRPAAEPDPGARRTPRETPLRIRDLTEAQSNEREARLADLRSLLRETLGHEPTFFKYADAFLATLSPAQLQKIAASPLVKAVRRNARVGRRRA